MTSGATIATLAARFCAVSAVAASLAPAGNLPQTAAESTSPNRIRRYIDNTTPSFLSLSGEFRFRFESRQGLGYRAGNNDSYGLPRTRVDIGIEPAPWLRFGFQGQDARAPGIREGLANSGVFCDAFDVRQAYVQLGEDQSPVSLTVGRQLPALGDQRLVGALDWANTSRAFDAVKLQFQGAGAKIGDELNVTFTVPLTSVLTLGGGSGYMIPGPFLKANTPRHGNTFSFFFFTYKF